MQPDVLRDGPHMVEAEGGGHAPGPWRFQLLFPEVCRRTFSLGESATEQSLASVHRGTLVCRRKNGEVGVNEFTWNIHPSIMDTWVFLL